MTRVLKIDHSFPTFEVFPGRDDSFAPCIILIHEIWGLNEHIKDVANRFSNEGYHVLAPDLFEGTGVLDRVKPDLLHRMNHPETKDEAQKELRSILAPVNTKDFSDITRRKLIECFNYLKDKTGGKIGILGFCFGGTYSFQLAVDEPNLSACVVFYGHEPSPITEVEKINCPVLGFYGEKDEALVSKVPSLVGTMKEYKKEFEFEIYENAGHAFFNDMNTRMYNKIAADKSWKKSLAFLLKNLK